MSKTKHSPAYIGVEHTWDHANKATAFSWTRLNQSMHASLSLAITSGQRFDVDDFRKIFDDFRGKRWSCGQERYFGSAVRCGNMSAIQSFEAFAERGPFIVDKPSGARGRVVIGSRFDWRGAVVFVTSFAGKNERGDETVIVCAYHPWKEGDYSNKIKRRIRISTGDIIADRKERKQRTALVARVVATRDTLTPRQYAALFRRHGVDPIARGIEKTIDIEVLQKLVEEAEARAEQVIEKG